MNEIMLIPSIVSGDWNTAHRYLFTFALIYTCVFVAEIIDLILGVAKSKARGNRIVSYRFRDTIVKSIKYYSLLMLLSLSDCIASVLYGTPMFTMAGGLGICLVEIKSWFERASYKERKDLKTVVRILKSKENLAEAFSEELNRDTDLNKNDNKSNSNDSK